MSYQVKRGRTVKKKRIIERQIDENGDYYFRIPTDIFPPEVRDRMRRISDIYGDGKVFEVPDDAIQELPDGGMSVALDWLYKKVDN